jgi:hypothetical protein
MLLEYTTWLGAWLFVAWPSVYALLAVIIPFGLAAPITDSVVEGYRVAMSLLAWGALSPALRAAPSLSELDAETATLLP